MHVPNTIPYVGRFSTTFPTSRPLQIYPSWSCIRQSASTLLLLFICSTYVSLRTLFLLKHIIFLHNDGLLCHMVLTSVLSHLSFVLRRLRWVWYIYKHVPSHIYSRSSLNIYNFPVIVVPCQPQPSSGLLIISQLGTISSNERAC